jgi:hypothetical protein
MVFGAAFQSLYAGFINAKNLAPLLTILNLEHYNMRCLYHVITTNVDYGP